MRISRRAALTGATAAVAGFDAELLEIGKTAALPGLDGGNAVQGAATRGVSTVMCAYGGKADALAAPSACLLIATSRSSQFLASSVR